ncbi:MAG TPA: DUF4358 domain-containing protein [Candidatus Acidoferrum sp.]|nr:DUF4358 domain-containing protein [Candidatus Acidoferrum sp.]
MKKRFALLLACLLALTAAACSRGSAEADMKASKPLDELAEEIAATVGATTLIREEDPDTLKEYFGYDLDKYAGYAIYNPPIVSADTIHIVELTDIDDMTAAKAELEANKARVVKAFDGYLPGPYAMAQEGQVVTKGRYAMLIISSDNAKAVELFNGAIS